MPRDRKTRPKSPFLAHTKLCQAIFVTQSTLPYDVPAKTSPFWSCFSGPLALFSDFFLVFWSPDFGGLFFPLSDFGLVFESLVRTYFGCHLVLLFSPLSADTGFHNHDGGYGLHHRSLALYRFSQLFIISGLLLLRC